MNSSSLAGLTVIAYIEESPNVAAKAMWKPTNPKHVRQASPGQKSCIHDSADQMHVDSSQDQRNHPADNFWDGNSYQYMLLCGVLCNLSTSIS